MIYILDTNIISGLLRSNASILKALELHKNDIIYISPPVHFEVKRGLLWKDAHAQLNSYLNDFLPLFQWIPLLEADWERAAILWSETRKAGRQLSDIDLLIAAITLRVNGIVASNDNDFDALNIPRENWHDL